MINDSRMNTWSSQLFDHPLPGDADPAGSDSGSRFGLLWGNGNHCDGEAWIEFASDLIPRDITHHYSDLRNVEVQTLPNEPGEPKRYTYRVVITTPIGSAGLDLRCH